MTKTWWLVASIAAAATIGVNAAQGPAAANIMREKLGHTQRILGAVVTSDWVTLEMQSQILEHLTTDPRWRVLDSPEYARHSKAFKQSVRALHTAAVERDLEAAPRAYVALTLQCVNCHRYLARSRFAR